MKNKIVELAKTLISINSLIKELDNKDYWINRAKEEAGFILAENDWISIKVETWEVAVHVYHKNTIDGARYFINGKWFDTSFPKKCPYLRNLLISD